jgi:hypothetical protein
MARARTTHASLCAAANLSAAPLSLVLFAESSSTATMCVRIHSIVAHGIRVAAAWFVAPAMAGEADTVASAVASVAAEADTLKPCNAASAAESSVAALCRLLTSAHSAHAASVASLGKFKTDDDDDNDDADADSDSDDKEDDSDDEEEDEDEEEESAAEANERACAAIKASTISAVRGSATRGRSETTTDANSGNRR